MQKELIPCQAKEGIEKGSWDPTGTAHGEIGGRLMQTSLCLLTLQVYYRYLPLYFREEDLKE